MQFRIVKEAITGLVRLYQDGLHAAFVLGFTSKQNQHNFSPHPALIVAVSSRSSSSSVSDVIAERIFPSPSIEYAESASIGTSSLSFLSANGEFDISDLGSYTMSSQEQRPAHQEAFDRSRSHSQDSFPSTPEPAPFTDAEGQEFSSLPSEESHILSSPPPVFVEPEVPDPFLVDDSDDSDDSASEDGDSEHHDGSLQAPHYPSSQRSLTSASGVEIPLTRPSSSQPAGLSSSAVNLNKAVPPPPPDSDDEEDAPELYLPSLVIPTMFLPIPNADPLTTLLTKYIYPPDKRPVRDLTGDWQRSDFHTLVMTNSWRALARMARDRIVTTNPEEVTLILGLWYLRLACLSRLRLFNQTSAECTNLFSVLNAIEPVSTRTYLFDRVLPFELEVMQARLKYWAGDHMAYLDALNALLRKCRTKARAGSGEDAFMWKERGARMCLIIASQLMEMKDLAAAAKLLEPLCMQGNSAFSPGLHSAVARIYLQGGNLRMAEKHFATVAADPDTNESTRDMNAALLASANGDWVQASERLKNILAKDPDNYVAVNNLSVALLSQGKLKEGIEVLEAALKASPSSVVVVEPFLFNLSTLYELRSASAMDKKRDLLVEVAKWSGDGLKTTCLKMPAN